MSLWANPNVTLSPVQPCEMNINQVGWNYRAESTALKTSSFRPSSASQQDCFGIPIPSTNERKQDKSPEHVRQIPLCYLIKASRAQGG